MKSPTVLIALLTSSLLSANGFLPCAASDEVHARSNSSAAGYLRNLAIGTTSSGYKSNASVGTASAGGAATSPTYPPPFNNIKNSHPRLILDDISAAKAKNMMYGSGSTSKIYQALVKNGTTMFTVPVVQYHTGDMLEESRTVLKRVLTLAFLFRADGDRRWFERAREEMLAAASFPNWHPDHFLDTAEMMAALATGYDWLYGALSPEDRKTIADAIFSKGLSPAKDFYDNDRDFWVHDNTTNWNVVCNSSILTAALALGTDDGDHSTVTSETARVALDHLKQGLGAYAPDGGWAEGPMYWRYATSYATRALAALQSACGSDMGLSNATGLEHTGDYILTMLSPTGLAFNYSDSTTDFHDCPALFWLASRYNQPLLAWRERQMLQENPNAVSALDVIWWHDGGNASHQSEQRCAKFFGGHGQVVGMRSSCSDTDAAYAGFTGGSNSFHHGHLGLGNFVYDVDGERWVTLLGPDNYNLPGYFDWGKGDDSPRWQYYRNNSLGQNVMIFAGGSQYGKAKGPMVEKQLEETSKVAWAICDLSSAYAKYGVKSARRGIALFKDQRRLLVQDEFNKPGTVEAVWQVHTPAKIELSGGRRAILSIGKHQVRVDLISPLSAHFTQQAVVITPPETPANGITKLMVRLDKAAGQSPADSDETIAVIFSPCENNSANDATMDSAVPLSKWNDALK